MENPFNMWHSNPHGKKKKKKMRGAVSTVEGLSVC